MPFQGTAMPAAGKAQAADVEIRVPLARRAVETGVATGQESGEVLFYRVAQVATRLNLHRSTIYRAIDSGALRAVRFGQGRGGLRVPAAALAEYLAASEVRPSVLAEVA